MASPIKKKVDDLKQKIILCDNFIARGIDSDFYIKEKENYQKIIKTLEGRQKAMKTVFSILTFVFLFLFFFALIYYILKQFI
jgi:hypothetical protein